MSTTPAHYENLREQKRDLEDDQGPGLGAYTGRDRTRIAEHTDKPLQGTKTVQANKDRFSRRG